MGPARLGRAGRPAAAEVTCSAGRPRATKGENKSLLPPLPASRIRSLLPFRNPVGPRGPQSGTGCGREAGAGGGGGFPSRCRTRLLIRGRRSETPGLCGARGGGRFPSSFKTGSVCGKALTTTNHGLEALIPALFLRPPTPPHPGGYTSAVDNHVLGQGLAPALNCCCRLTTRPRGTQEMEQRGPENYLKGA